MSEVDYKVKEYKGYDLKIGGVPDKGVFVLVMNSRPNLWGRIKTHLWNFVLPPHIELTYRKDKVD